MIKKTKTRHSAIVVKLPEKAVPCRYCKKPSRLPCTAPNFRQCGNYAEYCAANPPNVHKDSAQCNCASCCEQRASKPYGGRPDHYAFCECQDCTAARSLAQRKAVAIAWRQDVARSRAERKEAKRKRKDEARERNPAKWAAKDRANRPAGSKAKRKAERRERYVARKSWTRGSATTSSVSYTRAAVESPAVVRAPTSAELTELLGMHTYCRPHMSTTEGAFIQRFILPVVAAMPYKGTDKFGNIWAWQPHDDERKAVTTLFSAHTDDVSFMAGRRNVRIDDGVLSLGNCDKHVRCLGADNAAGCWLLMQLARAKKPGLYVWHRDEEHGGNGSRHFAVANRDHPRILALKRAIAFDRRRFKSIITQQRGSVCASDDFAKALAAQLGMGHEPDSHGTFTDTASYMDAIPECTNVSVGFQSEHSERETLHLGYLCALRDAVVACDWESLPAVRDPKQEAIEEAKRFASWRAKAEQPDENAAREGGKPRPKPGAKGPHSNGSKALVPVNDRREMLALDDSDVWVRSPQTLLELVEDYPEHVADILEQWGYSPQSLHKDICDCVFGLTSH